MSALVSPVERTLYELRFDSLFNVGRAFTFPCDATGRVDPRDLSEAARRSYQRVCEAVGREYSLPDLQRSALPRAR